MLLALLLAACAPSGEAPAPLPVPQAARSEGRVVVYTTAPLITMRALADRFEAAHPDVRVTLQREPRLADVALVSQRPAAASAPLWYEEAAIAWNPCFVTQEIRGWQERSAPAWKGRLAAGAAAACPVCAAPATVLPEDVLSALAAQAPVVHASFDAAVIAVLAGRQAVLLAAPLGEVRAHAGALRYAVPDGAPAVPGGWAAVLKEAPHPAAARLFVAWLAGEDGARAMQAAMGVRPARHGLPAGRQPVDAGEWAALLPQLSARWPQLLQAQRP